jgi:hypothetical protein
MVPPAPCPREDGDGEIQIPGLGSTIKVPTWPDELSAPAESLTREEGRGQVSYPLVASKARYWSGP